MTTTSPSATPVTLASAYDALRADLAAQPVPAMAPRVRQALRAPRAIPGWLRWIGSGAVLCGVAFACSMLLLLQNPADAPYSSAIERAEMARAGSGFLPVASSERWQRLMQNEGPIGAWVVPADLPRERLAAFGLPFDPAHAGDSVRAELLLHPSGEVLAVRVLSH